MATQIKVWDLLVRVFHWSLLAAFATAYIVEDEIMALHELAGYTVFTLVVVRIVWGFVGTRYARFAEFVRGPRAVFGYLRDLAKRDPPRYLGHNPAGGAMVIALLASLLATTASGMIAYGIEGDGVLGAWLWQYDVGNEHAAEEVHEFFANFTVTLAALHVAGVVLGSLVHRENLIRAMITGRKTID